ncbi:MAG: hypothetical protein U9N57_01305 [Pseudomonadota bacterium]|nr:hypothetical protein [Pseudomonadota bacterium]
MKSKILTVLASVALAGCNVGADADRGTTDDSTVIDLSTNENSTQTFTLDSTNVKSFVNSSLGLEMANPLGSYIESDPQPTLQSASFIPSPSQVLQKTTKSFLSARIVQDDNYTLMKQASTRAATPTIQFIQNPEDSSYFSDYAVKTILDCSVSGTKTTSVLDFNADGQLSMQGEYGYEFYENCNDGTSIIDGRFAISFKEVPEIVDGQYINLSLDFEYTNFRIGTLVNTVTYDGFFSGQIINFNNHHLVKYSSLGQKNLRMEDLSGNFFELIGAYTISSEWYDLIYNTDNLMTDLSNPTIADITSIDAIPTQSSFVDTDGGVIPTAEDLAGSFKFLQTFDYKVSTVNQGETVISVLTNVPFKGKVGQHPTEGEAFISFPGSFTHVLIGEESVTIQWGEETVTENNKEYTWDEFDSLIQNVTN